MRSRSGLPVRLRSPFNTGVASWHDDNADSYADPRPAPAGAPVNNAVSGFVCSGYTFPQYVLTTALTGNPGSLWICYWALDAATASPTLTNGVDSWFPTIPSSLAWQHLEWPAGWRWRGGVGASSFSISPNTGATDHALRVEFR